MTLISPSTFPPFRLQGRALRTGQVLILADGLILLAYCAFAAAVALELRAGLPWILNIERERSLPSLMNHLKWLAIAAAFAVAWWHGRQPVHAAMALVFLGVLADDALQGHETVNAHLVTALDVADRSAIRAGDLVGVATFAGLGLLACAAIWAGYRRSEGPARRDALVILGLIGLLAVFGVAVDAVHGMIGWTVSGAWQGPLGFLAGLIEDGGEMIVASALVVASVGMMARTRQG